MAISVVIGAGTDVVFGLPGNCITSVNWNFNPGRQDAFCLGSFSPSTEHVLYKPTQTVSITGYAPVEQSTAIPATEECADADTISATINPSTCAGQTASDIDGDFWLQSYSYSKETRDQPAQETWSLIKYKGSGITDFLQGVDQDNIALPTYVMRGITMGESTEGIGTATNTGITFDEVFAEAQTGSVSAGSFGTVRTVTHGSITAVGGGTGDAEFKGTGSASIPYTPLYI